MNTQSPINILVATLNWGIGHATRCVPIIRMLLERGDRVHIASDGRAGAFLRTEFPDLPYTELTGYNIKYARHGLFMPFKMAIQIPRISKAIHKEHKELNQLINTQNIQLVISDNRYGLWHKDIPSVLITHQLMLKMPHPWQFTEKWTAKAIACHIKKHNECWVPDEKGSENISGDLSHKHIFHNSTHFIGLLSRFDEPTQTKSTLSEGHILFILSGPEPQRSIFEKIVITESLKSDFKIVIVGGITEINEHREINNNITFYSHVNTEHLQQLILTAQIVVCRSGYSGIMDLMKLRAEAILIPTPGQTEQVYLAKFMNDKKYFHTLEQNNFTIDNIVKIKEFSRVQNRPLFPRNNTINKRIDFLSAHLSKM